jgi:hypothetical protein
MDCPRCGGQLHTYVFRGEEANGCDDCGFVGVEVEHQHEPLEIESWDDAINRFYEQQTS